MLSNLSRLVDINNQVYRLATHLRLLGTIAWPKAVEDEFITNFRRGALAIPKVTYEKVDYSAIKTQLLKLRDSFTPSDPMEVFTDKTIGSQLDLIELNECIGTSAFGEKSKQIFGAPNKLLKGTTTDSVMAAERLIKMTGEFSSPFVRCPESQIDAEAIKAYLERRIAGVFKERAPKVTVVEGLSAKATASARTIKIRAGRVFTPYDFKQLFYHEVMTHALTAINGEQQPILKAMGRSSLRSLETQEGLATFAELITGGMDLQRLRRLALRVLAIDMALQGANFVEVFKYCLAMGQSDIESYNSAHRIFRGGYPEKNIVFTKDCIYLRGLIDINNFFRWAMTHNKLNLCHLLFCGRIALEDLAELEEAYRYHWITPPLFTPAWFAKVEGLAGALSFSLLGNLIPMNFSDQNLRWSA